MLLKDGIPVPDFLSSRETYEKYEKSHNRNFGITPVSNPSVTPITYLNQYKVVTRTPVPQDEVRVPIQTISKQNIQPLAQKRIPFGRVLAAAIAIPLFIMFVLFIAVWFQELGFI
uniref:Uncharacterized protein n=1 Tax=Onchocerca volvulus TaxID=6282 RepID=A0A2K6VJN1_ONCVO